MNPNPPILIAGPARCGTTMLAGLLHYHGVWIGKARVTKAPETNSLLGTENTAIKEYLKSFSGGSIPYDFRAQILSLVPECGPWLVKTPQILFKWKAWTAHFQEARWLFPRRPVEEIVDSAMRHPGMKGSRFERQRTVEQQLELQDVVDAKRLRYVDTGRIASGDAGYAAEIVGFCGLDFNKDVFDGWIKPEMWHGSSGS